MDFEAVSGRFPDIFINKKIEKKDSNRFLEVSSRFPDNLSLTDHTVVELKLH